MATFGAKVLHPATLLPAVRSDIPVFVGSSKDPKAGGTLVCKKPKTRRCSARWPCAVARRW
jgi:aspartate kinase